MLFNREIPTWNQQRSDQILGHPHSHDNSAGNRYDRYNYEDNPFLRWYQQCCNYRASPAVSLRQYSAQAEPFLAQPCDLCEKHFAFREDLHAHIDAVHGGIQRYRNVECALLSLAPHVVKCQQWRFMLSSYAEFMSRTETDWQHPTESMREQMSNDGCTADSRWGPRTRAACVLCARQRWREDMHSLFLAGQQWPWQSCRTVVVGTLFSEMAIDPD